MSVWGTEDLHQESSGKDHTGQFEITNKTRITVLSGAGISAESGIPTFRGTDGLWNNEEIAKVATPRGFLANPVIGWQFYNERRINMASCEPNPAHKVFAKLEKDGYDVVIITQNIDQLHQRAGSSRVIELHGTVWRIRCSEPSCDMNPFDNHDVPMSIIPPLCERCGSVLRPDVVFFEEMLDPDVVQAAHDRARSSDLFFIIGTSGVVYPAAGFAQVAKVYDAYLVELNLEMTPLSSMCDLNVFGPCGETLPELINSMTQGRFTYP